MIDGALHKVRMAQGHRTRHQLFNRAADKVVVGIAEHHGRGRIRGLDDPAGSDDNDRFKSRFKYCGRDSSLSDADRMPPGGPFIRVADDG
ncbi:hypothetical protein GALL_536780 [mine drainage metagenome]|uniref:Uncharacterized protein n=1 Tax=mine drainage metagenome TaxID=410659 RepID=A0A1J5P136_9ZZZZ